MHYRLKSLSLATLVLSLSFPVSVAESRTKGIIPATLTSQTETTKQRKEEALRLLQLGIQQVNQGQFQEALKAFQEALAIFKQIGDTAREETTLNNIGEAYHNLGQYKKALDYYQQALAIGKKIKDTPGEGTTLNNIGAVYRNLGQYTKALDYYQQALVIVKKIGNTAGQGITLNNIGGVYRNLAQYTKALDYYQQALAIRKKIGNKRGEGTTLNNIGAVYDDLGQYTKALGYYLQALEIFTQIGNTAAQGTTLNNIGLVYSNLRQYGKALDFYLQALAIRKKIGNTAGEGTTLNNIGAVYSNLQQYSKALDYYQQALVIFRKIDYTEAEGTNLNNIGLVYSNLQQYSKALDYYQQALVIAKQIDDKAGEGTTLNNIGLVYSSLGQYADAEKTLFTAIEVLESLRTRELPDDQKISIFETQTQTYRFLQEALIAQNKINTALEISERSRARAFVDLLTSKISGNTDNKQTVKPPTLEQIKQIAKTQNSTLVEYSINESNLYVWVIKPTGEITFKQVDLKSLNTPLAELVKNSRFSIDPRDRDRGAIEVKPTGAPVQKENLQTLHKILIAPIASLLPTNPEEKVIFIPHESLFLVPFVALQDKDGKYLIEKYTILTAPAIQVLDLTHQQRQKVRGKDVLVMGNPIMPKVGVPLVQLDPLKGAEKEALTIANFFKTKAITGKNATKAALKQKLSSARIIHLATHGLLADTDKSIPTAIALAPTKNDDGLLTPAEIVDLSINAELVVLSACDTGRGAITGDGVIGLSRSLITAGAPSVIVSLWSVPDAPTAELMMEFYQQWQQNPDKAVALRNAMLKTMKKSPAPVNWAAFTLIGESK